MQKYETNPLKGNKSDYFELEIYDRNKARYFLRNPEKEPILNLSHLLEINGWVYIHHLDKTEKNGGKRIIQLQLNDQIIYSFEEAVYQQNYTKWWIRLISFVLILITILLYWIVKSKASSQD